MRVTLKYLTKFCQSKFEELGITEYEIVSVERTKFSRDAYEGGAYYLHVNFQSTSDPKIKGYFLGFYPCWLIEQYLNNGYELYIRFDKFHILSNCVLDIRKTSKT